MAGIYDTKGADRKSAVAAAAQDLEMEAKQKLADLGAPLPPGDFQDGINGPTPEFVNWISNQPPEVQQAYDQVGLLSNDTKVQAFKGYGVPLPGIGETGAGLKDSNGKPIDPKTLATWAAAAEAKRGHDLEADVAGLSEEDTTYAPTLDQGPGYKLQDTLQYLGDADPLELATQQQVINQTRSDETGVQGQRDALQGYRDIYGQGGLTAMDRAALAQTQNMERMRARAAEQGVMRDAAEQGRGGNMLEFLSRQQAQQAASGRIAEQDMNTAAMAQARKERALEGMSSAGNQIQDAQDIIDNFNAEGERTRIRENIDRANSGTEATWNENQNREHANQVFFNQGATGTFGADTIRSAANTDRSNQANLFNVTQGGARGLLKDRLAARAVAGGQGLQAAGMGYQYGSDQAAASAAHDAAVASFVGDLAGAGAGAIGAIYGGPAGATAGYGVGKATGKALASA